MTRIVRSALKLHADIELDGPDGRRLAFVKFDGFKQTHADDVERERAALSLLADLAVPALIELDDAQRRVLFGALDTDPLCTEHVGERIGKQPCSADQLIGLWLFVAEQLAAFRRRRLLYSDIKTENIMVSPDLSRVTIIDLEGCAVLDPEDSYGAWQLKQTRPFGAPEHDLALDTGNGEVTEACVVHQLGSMMCHSWNLSQAGRGWFADFRDHAHLRVACQAAGRGRLLALIERCIEADPQARPPTIAAVWAELDALSVEPAHAEPRRIFTELRAPYAHALAEHDHA
ncbi:hypothetical protein G6O69_35195 [Pseudenhygromyxa sp. WMMC2535]|uniref:hypothetical protein n=1 Tax=Pseudenhygromyxa sp. WMMC2535 TaxID=2712867 RepID=UPI0015548422|nr:hypothetical protein [Pseudenhygromyxa sp. WMMC2535]NVB43123.1 hypothetical protein [Pseudenhygromyxa sp. WMMC2535]